MVNKELLEDSLEKIYSNVDFNSVKYNKDIFPRLFEKFNYYDMAEYSYCCYGLECSCWTELVEQGIWGLTLEGVKSDILRNVKKSKKYLYNGRRYGKDRFYMYETDEECHIYIYLRDLIACDYAISFYKKEEE